jgi:HK97 family phage prohead protease
MPAGSAPLTAVGGRRFRAVASTGIRDREGDVVEQRGWRLEAYRKNPVVMWAHLYDRTPIARAIHVAVEGDRLMLEAEFPEPGVSRFADDAAALIEAGLLGAVSVGFRPLRWELMPDGRGVRFLEQELLEVSLVPVPANAEALIVPALLGRRAAPVHPRLVHARRREVLGGAGEHPLLVAAAAGGDRVLPGRGAGADRQAR